MLAKFDAIVKKEHTTPVLREWDVLDPTRPKGMDNGE
jgi:hypothetical protein